MANFQEALKKVLVYEGGYVNDKDDAGGETYKGITKRIIGINFIWMKLKVKQ